MIAKADLTDAMLISAGGTPPEVFSTWDGTLRTLVGVIVGLAVGMAVGRLYTWHQQRSGLWRSPPEGWGRRPGPR